MEHEGECADRLERQLQYAFRLNRPAMQENYYVCQRQSGPLPMPCEAVVANGVAIKCGDPRGRRKHVLEIKREDIVLRDEAELDAEAGRCVRSAATRAAE